MRFLNVWTPQYQRRQKKRPRNVLTTVEVSPQVLRRNYLRMMVKNLAKEDVVVNFQSTTV
jgi:hypothetical protein